MATRIEGDRVYSDDVTFLKAPAMPEGSIDDDMIESGAGIQASKVVHQIALHHVQADGSDVAAAVELVHIARGAGELLAVSVVADAVPAGGDKEVSVEVKKSTGGAAFATLLDSAVTLSSSDTDRTVKDATVASSNDYAADDVISIEVSVSGSTGSQAQGLCVTAWVRENPD